MEDQEIVALYHARKQSAIAQTAEKYGKYCHAVAYRILQSDEDAEECVSDTYLRAWNAMPPESPTHLRLFLSRITRNLALQRYAKRHAAKRGGGEAALMLDELGDCIPDADTTEGRVEARQLSMVLDLFLERLPDTERRAFLRRYWYAQSVHEIAQAMGLTENHVKVTLHRVRKKLRNELEKEGVTV